MKGASGSVAIDPAVHAKVCADNAQLRQERDALQHQLDWFKRQLFGRKSEKRLIENPDQLDLGRLLGDTPPPSEPPATAPLMTRSASVLASSRWPGGKKPSSETRIASSSGLDSPPSAMCPETAAAKGRRSP